MAEPSASVAPLPRLPLGVCAYGMAYACGLSWAGAPGPNPNPITAEQLIDIAAESGLSGVEIPARMMGDTTPERLAGLRAYGEERGIGFVFPGMQLRAEVLLPELEMARILGATTLRCTLSGVLCGDRRGFPGGWRSHLMACEGELEALLPEAERLGIAIAMENHQDADSEDLLALCRRFESRYLGITLDTGNPLAVMEEPVEFAERVGPYLRHAHLKDYRIYPAANGFRLARCAMGEGAIDFPALLRVLDAQEWPVTRNLEMGALQSRLIPMLERTWWDEYSPRDARDTLPALEVVWRQLRPAGEDWQTPWERGCTSEELEAYEWEEYHRSIRYARTIMAA